MALALPCQLRVQPVQDLGQCDIRTRLRGTAGQYQRYAIRTNLFTRHALARLRCNRRIGSSISIPHERMAVQRILGRRSPPV